MPVPGTRNDENRAETNNSRWRRPPGRRPTHTGALEPVLESGPDADTYPELLPPMVGEHVEQSVLPFDIPRRHASVEEVRHGHDLL